MNRGFALCALLLGLGVAAACGPDQGPPYGGANALQGVSVPIAQPKAGSCGTPVSDTNCAVKFGKDIMPLLQQHACVGCHQAGQAPTISTDAAATYKAISEHRLGSDAKDPNAPRYINVCSKDPNASFFLCNVQAGGPKAKCGEHMPTDAQIPAEALAKIKTWVECGAPEN